MRIVQSPSGAGSGEQWVRERFVIEVEACRVRQAETRLIVVIDADTHTVQARIEQLDSALREAGVHIIPDETRMNRTPRPRRNIETWILCLSDVEVNEETDYKNRRENWTEMVRLAAITLLPRVESTECGLAIVVCRFVADWNSRTTEDGAVKTRPYRPKTPCELWSFNARRIPASGDLCSRRQAACWKRLAVSRYHEFGIDCTPSGARLREAILDHLEDHPRGPPSPSELLYLRGGHAARSAPAAQKSVRMGTGPSATICVKADSSTSSGSFNAGRGSLHEPQRPVWERCFAGMRFPLPQAGQWRTREKLIGLYLPPSVLRRPGERLRLNALPAV